MIKKTIINYLLFLILICFSSTSFAQNYDDRCFIAQFNNSATPNQIDSFLSSYNLYIEEGPTTAFISKFVLVCVDTTLGFPEEIIYENGGDDDIDAVIGSIIYNDSENDDIFDATGLNYDIDLTSTSIEASTLTYRHPLEACGLGSSFSINTIPGNNATKVGILDTGIKMGGSAEVDAFFDHSNLGWNIINNTPWPIDDNGHGTHMASTMTLATPSNLSTVLSLEAFKTHNNVGNASLWDIIMGINMSILAGNQIINLSNSYSAPYNHRFSNAPLSAAIEEAAVVAGVLFIAAAGNKGTDNDNPNGLSSYPASFLSDNILSVTAIDCNYTIPTWANIGTTSVDIAAPGVGIWGLDHNQQFVQMDGTSIATALTTRLAAMLATQQTSFEYEKIKCSIINGAKELPLDYSNDVLSKGYIDAASAQVVFDDNLLCPSSFPTISSGPTPNPVDENIFDASIQNNEVLNVYSEKEQLAQLSIFNNLGQILFTKEIDIQVGQNYYSLEGFTWHTSPSMYFCNIECEHQHKTIKFVR